MLWRKPDNLKYTDLCIYVDSHTADIAQPGKYPVIENTVYNYLWLIVKAIAIKKKMFKTFDDYDGYAFYSATRLYRALVNNYNNQGKTIKGKLIRPIKSCLDYLKALLNPMKIEYQREVFNTIISPEFTSKYFDPINFAEVQKQYAQNITVGPLKEFYTKKILSEVGTILTNVLEHSPFAKINPDYHKLRISLLLNCLHDLSSKSKLDFNPQSVIVWKMPKTMGSYIKVLLKEFYIELRKNLLDAAYGSDIEDSILDKMISQNGDGNYED